MPNFFEDTIQPQQNFFADTLAPPKPDQGDFTRGVKESFQQLPQLGYGLMAGAGAAAESAFGEGGISTGIKNAGIKGYQEWGDKIAKDAKPSDSWDYSYDQAKQGNFGALVDWLQHGIGYVGGQAIQTLATGGIGAVGGKFVAGTAAKQIAEGMVAKEAATIAGSAAAKDLTAEAISKLATANVAAKFATIGQSVAVGANAFGMEGGEIFGDLTSSNKDRALSGSEIGKAFAATLGAGALEFVGDKVGLDIMLGKSKLLKPTEFMPGMKGRLARGAVAAAGAAPIEAGTEYAQTLAEEYGKGNDPFSDASLAQARDAAALGALGGTVVGGAGGSVHGAKVRPNPVADIAKAKTVDDAIAAATTAVQSTPSQAVIDAGQAWQAIAPSLPSDDLAMQRQISEATANLAERSRIEAEREGAARSAARDANLESIGQQWQSLGITQPQDDLQAQRAGMRPIQDGTTDGVQPGPIAGAPVTGTSTAANLDAGTGSGVRAGLDGTGLGNDRVGESGQQPVRETAPALTFPFVKNESGTVLVTGNPADIRTAFPGLTGTTKFTDGQPAGVLFGTSATPSVLAKLETPSVQNNAPRSDTEAKAPPAQTPAPAGSEPVAPAGVPGAGGATVQAAGVASNGKAAKLPPPELGEEVSRYNGKFGKGMGRDAARLEAQRLNRTNDGITYTAEEHNDPKLENPYAVIGRKDSEQTAMWKGVVSGASFDSRQKRIDAQIAEEKAKPVPDIGKIADLQETKYDQAVSEELRKASRPSANDDGIGQQTTEDVAQAEVNDNPSAKQQLGSQEHDTGSDIPPRYFKKVKVDHQVWIEDERVYETAKVSAKDALASINEDLDNYQKLLNCMKG